ncbi:MAG: lipopolysaccharide biosynthesis protein [Flavobacteriales bacterium]
MAIVRIRQLLGSDFSKSLSVLLSGTIIAQAVGYLIAPILTRLYTTAEMGELGLYMRLTGFISAIATLRYEAALPLPKIDGHSYLLYRLSYRISLIVLIITSLVYTFMFVTKLESGFDWWFYLLTVLGAASLIIVNIGTNWSVRIGQYGIISRQKIANSTISNMLRWGFAYVHLSTLGLVLATFIGYFLSSLEFAFSFGKIHQKFKHFISKKKTRVLMRTHKEFPLVSLPHVFVDNAKEMLIATFIFAYFSDSVYGSYNHAYTMLRLPLMLIGVSLGQLFYNRASELMHQGKSIIPMLNKMLIGLTLFAIIPFGILFFFGEYLFAFVFGKEWGLAGSYSETMSIWLMFNFIFSPIGALPLILKKQKIFFLMGIFSSSLMIFPFWFFPWMYGESQEVFKLSLQTVSYMQAVWLLFTIIVFYRFALKTNRRTQS